MKTGIKLLFLVVVISIAAQAQYVDRILRPCAGGSAPYDQVVAAPNGNVEVTTCTGGALKVNGVTVTPGAGGAPGGSNTQVQFNNAGNFGGSGLLVWQPPALSIGLNGVASGQLKLNGVAGGTVTVRPASAAGTWALTLPTTGGTNGFFLQTDGAGVTTWAAGGGGGGGITTLNTLTDTVQTFAVGSAGADFGISSASPTHTFNLPSAGIGARGLVTASPALQTFDGPKSINAQAPQFRVTSSLTSSQTSIAFRSSTTDEWFAGVDFAQNGTKDFFFYDGTAASVRQLMTRAGPISLASDIVLGFTSSGDATGTVDIATARNGAGVLEVNSGTAGTFRDLRARAIQVSVFTVATLPTCNAGAEGKFAGVSDALAPAFLVTIAGGGAVHTSAYCNGTNWVAN